MIDFGALVLPITSNPVPLKSKIAFLYFLSIVKASVIGVPSSMYSVFVRVSTSDKLFSNENLQSRFLTDYAALSQMKPTYVLNYWTPYYWINLLRSLIPISFAAICAKRSETLSSNLLDYLKSYRSSAYLKELSLMRWNCSTATPYSLRDFENAGILPGVIPPISAWCPREAKYILMPFICEHEITVKSGRWEPPAAGWLVSITSPT